MALLRGAASLLSPALRHHHHQLLPAARHAATVSAASPEEKAYAAKLLAAVKTARVVEVEDVSGGCGAMYRIHVEADEFKGQSIVKQHQAVTAALKDDIGKWHGMRLTTKS